MDTGYKFLAENDLMWAKMFMQILENHHIPCTALPVYGAGLAIRAGIQERLKILVPAEKTTDAKELLEEIFSDCV